MRHTPDVYRTWPSDPGDGWGDSYTGDLRGDGWAREEMHLAKWSGDGGAFLGGYEEAEGVT